MRRRKRYSRALTLATVIACERRLAEKQHPSRIARELQIGRETVRRIANGEHILQQSRKKHRCGCGALILDEPPCLACRLRNAPGN